MLTKTARKYCGRTCQNTRFERSAEPDTYPIHPQDVFRRANAPESMSTIHLTKVSKEVRAHVSETNAYFVKTPGEVSGKEEGIPM